ncbi:MAG: hypothetical protein ACKVX7_06075 [Planctomycetota bacterium]
MASALVIEILLFVGITSVVGTVTLTLAEHREQNWLREYFSYSGMAILGIAGFTAAILALSAVFQ